MQADIVRGLTAVIGANGVGKSNCVRGLVYALTGIVDGLWGNQQTLQKDAASDIGYAEASFTDGTVTYAIRRYATSSVKFPDVIVNVLTKEVVAQRRQKVNEFMENVFGMPCQLMFQVCWGRQGELAMLLKSTPTVIGTFLQQVFDMKPLEKLRDKLKLQIDAIVPYPQSCVLTRDNDKRELDALAPYSVLAERVTTLQTTISGLTDARDTQQRIISTGMTADAKATAMTELTAALKEMDSALTARPEHLIDTSRHASDVSIDVYKQQQMLSTAKNNYNASKLQREAMEVKVSDAQTAQKAFEQNCTDVDVRTLPPKNDICEFCGGRIVDKYRYEQSVLIAVTGYKDKQEYDAYVTAEKTRLSGLVDKLRADVDVLRKSELAYKKEADDATETLNLLNNEYQSAVYLELLRQRKAVQDSIDTLSSADIVDDALVTRFDDTCRLLAEAQDALNAAVADAADNKARRELLSKALQDDEKVVAQYEINNEARNALAQIRDALSQSRAQARYLKAKIRCINTELARYLTFTGMPFSLRLDDSSRTFIFTTADGYEHPAAHLSGAQQAMAAVALQMALFAVMRPNMNLYLIDEPTEALDVENKTIMAEMFSRMNSMLPSVEGTMLIITRDAPIVQSCENVIELKEN